MKSGADIFTWLQLAPFPDAPEEVDQTIFTVDKSGGIGYASRLAEKVVEEAHRYNAHSSVEITGYVKFLCRTFSCRNNRIREVLE